MGLSDGGGDHYEDDDGDPDDDNFFAESEGIEYTVYDPRFYKIPALGVDHNELAPLKVVELIQMYVDARNQLATDRKGYKAREAAVKTHLNVISMYLRERGDALGVDSFKTDAGTAFRNVKTKFQVSDWAAMVEYIKETGNFQILQKRVSPNAVKEVVTEDGALPGGVTCFDEVEFSVRKPSARKSK